MEDCFAKQHEVGVTWVAHLRFDHQFFLKLVEVLFLQVPQDLVLVLSNHKCQVASRTTQVLLEKEPVHALGIEPDSLVQDFLLFRFILFKILDVVVLEASEAALKAGNNDLQVVHHDQVSVYSKQNGIGALNVVHVSLLVLVHLPLK